MFIREQACWIHGSTMFKYSFSPVHLTDGVCKCLNPEGTCRKQYVHSGFKKRRCRYTIRQADSTV